MQEVLRSALNSLTFTFAGETKISDPIQVGVNALNWLLNVTNWWEQQSCEAFQNMEEQAIAIIRNNK